MSLFTTVSLTCPNCGEMFEIEAVESVNADRRPDLRDEIIAGSFQVYPCAKCGEPVRLEPQFNYLEVGANLWIAAYPGRMMPDYLEVEDGVSDVFDNSYGAHAMPAAQAIGNDLNVRLTFGWPAIREKLVLSKEGISDTGIEQLKLEILRRVPDAPLAPGIELRFAGIEDDMLHFAWIETESEAVLQEFAVKRSLLDELSDNAAAWGPVRSQLENGPFVDMQKLYMGEGRAASE